MLRRSGALRTGLLRRPGGLRAGLRLRVVLPDGLPPAPVVAGEGAPVLHARLLRSGVLRSP
jgi:hypothetical protein